MTIDTFRTTIAERLRAVGMSDEMTARENELIVFAFERGVGPVDTACQIEADRQDAAQ